MKTIKFQRGFTLVELMVVVAIIGILSAIAVPNFKKYQAKAKSSEAKLQLASLYSAEISFMADYDNYATCLGEMGYDPSGSAAARYYTVGFSAASDSNARAVTNGATCPADSRFVYPAGKLVAGGTIQENVAGTNVVAANGTTFIAGADGFITDKEVSRWTINEKKELKNPAIGY
jgi:type IV pilus assembly protein PilA